MKFTPKSEDQIAAGSLWPAGEYGFEVIEQIALGGKLIETMDRESKAGNDMIQLVLKVYNADGDFITVIDYLLESVAYKLRHACDACGLIDQYQTGSLIATDFIGKTGFLKLRQGKPNGDYGPKNEVQDYLKADSDAAAPAPVKQAPRPIDQDLDDSIPF